MRCVQNENWSEAKKKKKKEEEEEDTRTSLSVLLLLYLKGLVCCVLFTLLLHLFLYDLALVFFIP